MSSERKAERCGTCGSDDPRHTPHGYCVDSFHASEDAARVADVDATPQERRSTSARAAVLHTDQVLGDTGRSALDAVSAQAAAPTDVAALVRDAPRIADMIDGLTDTSAFHWKDADTVRRLAAALERLEGNAMTRDRLAREQAERTAAARDDAMADAGAYDDVGAIGVVTADTAAAPDVAALVREARVLCVSPTSEGSGNANHCFHCRLAAALERLALLQASTADGFDAVCRERDEAQELVKELALSEQATADSKNDIIDTLRARVAELEAERTTIWAALTPEMRRHVGGRIGDAVKQLDDALAAAIRALDE